MPIPPWWNNLQEWRERQANDINTKNPHEILFRDLEARIMPRIAEAGKHNNRHLVLSLADEAFKRIQQNENTLPLIAPCILDAYKRIRRELKQYLIKSAYASKDDFIRIPRGEINIQVSDDLLTEPCEILRQEALGEDLALPCVTEEGEGVRHRATEDGSRGARKKRAYRKREEGVLVLDEREVKEDIGRARVVQSSKKDLPAWGMRDVIQNTDHFQNDSVTSSSPPGLQKNTTPDQIPLDNASKACNNNTHKGPFSIEDFSLEVQGQRNLTLDDLVKAVDGMIEEVG